MDDFPLEALGGFLGGLFTVIHFHQATCQALLEMQRIFALFHSRLHLFDFGFGHPGQGFKILHDLLVQRLEHLGVLVFGRFGDVDPVTQAGTHLGAVRGVNHLVHQN